MRITISCGEYYLRINLVDIIQDRTFIDSILKSKIKKNVLNYFFEYVAEQNMLKRYADIIFD